MGFREWLAALLVPPGPRNETWYTNSDSVPGWFLAGNGASSGVTVTRETALKVAVAWRCVNIINTCMAGMPLDLMKRVDERRRVPAEGEPLRDVLTVRPNRWQTPGDFKRQMQTALLLKGNAYAFKNRLGTRIRELIPLDPERITVEQNDDLSLTYEYRGRKGGVTRLSQADVMHMRGLSIDGVNGLSVIAYAREAMGLSIQAEKVNAKLFKNGQFRSQIFQKKEGELGEIAYERLKKDLKDLRGADDEDAGGAVILEDGLEVAKPAFNAEELQFLELRQFTRTDVGMFFGVPPFLYGDTEKSTSWGTGIEQQNIGFLQYTIQQWITVWEEAIQRDCLAAGDPSLYVRFDSKGFFRLDAASRREYFKAALGSGGSPAWMTPNEVREKEDMEPREESWADELPKAQPPKAATETKQDEPAQAA